MQQPQTAYSQPAVLQTVCLTDCTKNLILVQYMTSDDMLECILKIYHQNSLLEAAKRQNVNIHKSNLNAVIKA